MDQNRNLRLRSHDKMLMSLSPTATFTGNSQFLIYILIVMRTYSFICMISFFIMFYSDIIVKAKGKKSKKDLGF